jgi:hypothetical protein
VSRAPLEAPRAEPGAPSAERGLPPARTDAESVERSLQPAHAEFKRAVPDPPRARAAAPEVLIAQDEAAALRHLFSAIGSGRLEAKALPDLASASAGTTEIEEIVMDPITIHPLAPLEGE